MNILGVDVGFHNLGLTNIIIDETFNIIRADEVVLVDLTDVTHQNVSVSQCQLHHTNELSDRLAHAIQEYFYLFRDAHKIIIERQPIQGLTNVEQLLFSRFRDKAVLCHPKSMHCANHWQGLNYEQRKIKAVELAEPYLCHLPGWPSDDQRQHDLADAFCFVKYYCDQQRKKIFFPLI